MHHTSHIANTLEVTLRASHSIGIAQREKEKLMAIGVVCSSVLGLVLHVLAVLGNYYYKLILTDCGVELWRWLKARA
jgi:hypothetical protein